MYIGGLENKGRRDINERVSRQSTVNANSDDQPAFCEYTWLERLTKT